MLLLRPLDEEALREAGADDLRAVPTINADAVFRELGDPETNKILEMSQTTEICATPAIACEAELIFDPETRARGAEPIKVLGRYTCDCRRPDWEQRWRDWNSRQNPYLNLFLCTNHARKLGLIR